MSPSLNNQSRVKDSELYATHFAMTGDLRLLFAVRFSLECYYRRF